MGWPEVSVAAEIWTGPPSESEDIGHLTPPMTPNG